MLPHLFSAYDLSGPLDEHEEQTKRQFLQFEAGVVARESALAGVQFVWAEAVADRFLDWTSHFLWPRWRRPGNLSTDREAAILS